MNINQSIILDNLVPTTLVNLMTKAPTHHYAVLLVGGEEAIHLSEVELQQKSELWSSSLQYRVFFHFFPEAQQWNLPFLIYVMDFQD